MGSVSLLSILSPWFWPVLKLTIPSAFISETLLQAPNDHLLLTCWNLPLETIAQGYLLQEALPD